MAHLLAPAPFDVEIDDGRSIATRWTSWIRRFDVFLEASSFTDDRPCIATLLHVGGEKIEEIYEAKRNASTLKKDEKYAVIKKMFSDYFLPQKNIDMQTYQRQGEGIDAYSVRLKTLATSCEFGTSTDREIKLQLIQGCLDKRIKLKAAQDNSSEFSSEAEQGSSEVEAAYQLKDGDESVDYDDNYSIFSVKSGSG
ncbi:Retrovirus-related Pol poly from transposon [Brachionus plicatilis]|uniref:Retrovirus-related Pol poly from transposon n=1 Tax=Brachionus plicatilis TaxID=10195 RepID=A0A3M7PP56_BRAPC|nr:Retrovirus-related Pol poly from transposon [Brachionus plicatilis]